MSSPAAAAPTPMQKEHSKINNSKPGGTNPSTPAAHPTPSSNSQITSFLSPNAGRVAGKSLGKSIFGQHSSPAVGTGTPGLNNALANFDSPSFVGMEPGSSSMGISLSGLGLGMGLSNSVLGASSMGGKLDDAERRRRLETVLHILSQDPGRVSPEGLERLARRLGMDMYSESGDKDRLMTLASGAFAIDVTFSTDGSTVLHVALQFHGLADSVSEKAPAAAAILFRDLQATSKMPTPNLKLLRFADNLARLSRLDKLSVTGANCFEAVAGILISLERLFHHEKESLRSSLPEPSAVSDDQLSINVMTSKSGRPMMHARRRVGLSLDYWRERRLRPPKTSDLSPAGTEQGATASSQPSLAEAYTEEDVFALVIECEHCSTSLFQSIRITNDWLSPRISRNLEVGEADETGLMHDSLDWTEPPQPLLAPAESDAMQTNATAPPAQTQARFVARVEPSLVLPFSVAMRILESVGVGIGQELAQVQAQYDTYDGLVMGRDRQSFCQTLITTESARSTSEIWNVRIYVSRSEYGRRLHEIPFGHPRQLLQILPVLRQYALFNSLLRSVVKDDTQLPKSPHSSGTRSTQDQTRSLQGQLEQMLGTHDSDPTSHRAMDMVLLQATPVPSLSVTLPSTCGPCSFIIEVLANGDLNLDVQKVASDQAGPLAARLMDRRPQITKALAICEDLPLWAEWMQTRILLEDGALW